MLFMCSPQAIIGHGDIIRLDSATDQIDFEAEIGVVIGRRGRNIATAEAAAAHPWPYLRQRRLEPEHAASGRSVDTCKVL